jgi:hypothetical protein
MFMARIPRDISNTDLYVKVAASGLVSGGVLFFKFKRSLAVANELSVILSYIIYSSLSICLVLTSYLLY